MPKKTLQEVNGELVWRDRESSIQIDCWYTWVKAFAVFSGVYVQGFPKTSPGLWQHLVYITQAADRYSWDALYKYDIKYRRKHAKDITLPWGPKDTDLWADEVQSTKVHDPNFHFMVPKQAPPPKNQYNTPTKSGTPCWNWNRGYCNTPNCKYNHNKCRRCHRTGHKSRDCYTNSDSNGNALNDDRARPRQGNIQNNNINPHNDASWGNNNRGYRR